MPSSSPAEPPEPPAPAEVGSPGLLDALLTQADRLREGIAAARRRQGRQDEGSDDAERRWERALWDLAAHQADELGGRLDQLREGPADDCVRAEVPGGPADDGTAAPAPHRQSAHSASRGAYEREAGRSLVGRVGSAEWNLLSDVVTWSAELHRMLGRTAQDGPLSLDELSSWVCSEDRAALTAAVTDCLIDGRPIDGEFRFVRPDGAVRALHFTGEPVLDADGGTASLWAVLRDVTELRRSEQAARESRESLGDVRRAQRTEHRLAAELRQSVLPPWRGPRRLPRRRGAARTELEVAATRLPRAAVGREIGGGWYDAFEVPGGGCVLTVGDLTGQGASAISGTALLLGSLRGLSMAGVEPDALLRNLNDVLDCAAHPALVSALYCRYDPDSRALTWSRAGHPAPVLFRDGTARPLRSPESALLGAAPQPAYEQRSERLEHGDLLLLHTGLPAPRPNGGRSPDGQSPEESPPGAAVLPVPPSRLASAGTAQDALRTVTDTLEDAEEAEDADEVCVLVARVV